jgi:hypothetical protein
MLVQLFALLVAGSCNTLLRSVDAYTLSEAFRQHDGLLCDKWEHYFDIYEEIFSNYRTNYGKINLMEIGVFMGGSLQLWTEYFGSQVTVTGLDVDSRLCEIPIFEKNIQMFCFNMITNEHKRELFFRSRSFDIVIDDASHKSLEIISMFK